MSERPSESGGLSSGDPLRGGDEQPRHESGLPGVPPGRPQAPPSERPGGWTGGYGPMSPPPPGAGGVAPTWASAPAAGQYVLAGWWSRVGAQLIDGLIIFAAAFVVLLVFGAIFSVGFLGGDESGIAALVVGFLLWLVAVTIAGVIYAPLLMARTNGKTLGRMATGIRVVRADGRPMTFGFAMLREVAVKALLFGAAGGITGGIANLLDVLWPLWDEENRALHDFVVNTRVVQD